jgi:hypothetical protein
VFLLSPNFFKEKITGGENFFPQWLSGLAKQFCKELATLTPAGLTENVQGIWAQTQT